MPDLLEDPHGMLTRLLEKVHKGHPNKTLDVGVCFGVSIAIYRCTGGKWNCIKSELFAEGECTSMFKDLQYIILPDVVVEALSDVLDQIKLAGCIATSSREDLTFLGHSKEFANCIFYCSKKPEQSPVTSADRDHTQLRPTPQVTQETRTAVENPTATTAGRFSQEKESSKTLPNSIRERQREPANAFKPVKPIEWGKPIAKPKHYVNNPFMNQNPANFSSTYEDTTISFLDLPFRLFGYKSRRRKAKKAAELDRDVDTYLYRSSFTPKVWRELFRQIMLDAWRYNPDKEEWLRVTLKAPVPPLKVHNNPYHKPDLCEQLSARFTFMVKHSESFCVDCSDYVDSYNNTRWRDEPNSNFYSVAGETNASLNQLMEEEKYRDAQGAEETREMHRMRKFHPDVAATMDRLTQQNRKDDKVRQQLEFCWDHPIVVKTLAGDTYTLEDWGHCNDLKAAVYKLALKTIGKPATFELLGNLGNGGGETVQIDGKYGSDDRRRMMVRDSGFNFELTLVNTAKAASKQ